MNTAFDIPRDEKVSPPSAVAQCAKCGAVFITAPSFESAKWCQVIRLRCYDRQLRSDLYLAECIDLDIVAEGSTKVEAISGLQDAMHGYRELAFEGEYRGLVLRQ